MSKRDFESLIIRKAKREAYKTCLYDLLELQKQIPIFKALKDLIKKYKKLIK